MAELTLEGTAYETVGYGSTEVAKESVNEGLDATNVAKESEANTSTANESVETKEAEKKDTYEGFTNEEFEKFNFGDKATKKKEESQEAGTKDTAEKAEANKEVSVPVTEKEIVYDFKMPENVDLSCELMDKFKDIAKKHKLPNEDAQVYVDLVGQMVNNEIDSQKKALVGKIQEWQKDLKSDPEVGGKNFEETHRLANLAMDAYGGKEFRKFLDLSGVGNHKVIAKFLVNVGKTLAEDDGIVTGGKAFNTDKLKPTKDVFGNPMLDFPSMKNYRN